MPSPLIPASSTLALSPCISAQDKQTTCFEPASHAGRLDPSTTNGLMPMPETRRFRSRTGEVILLVDDQESIRSMVQCLLKPLGYHVLTAASGQQALDLVQLRGPRLDLVLSDVVMPGMYGPELIRRLTQTSAAFRVLFMSGHAARDLRSGELDISDAPFIQKPFDPPELAARVRELLDAPANQGSGSDAGDG